MILRCPVRFIVAGKVSLACLRCDCIEALLLKRLLLSRSSACLNTTLSTVKADAVDVVIDDDCLVHINIGDYSAIHIHHCCVVAEAVTYPASATKAHATISEAVIHATVEPNVRAPVTGMPEVNAIAPAPVTRSPKQTDCRSDYPGSRNPVVAHRPISPVTRSPHIVRPGAKRLFIDRQYRRSNRNRNTDTDLRKGNAGHSAQQRNQYQATQPSEEIRG
jgi:hypothetical protein